MVNFITLGLFALTQLSKVKGQDCFSHLTVITGTIKCNANVKCDQTMTIARKRDATVLNIVTINTYYFILTTSFFHVHKKHGYKQESQKE